MVGKVLWMLWMVVQINNYMIEMCRMCANDCGKWVYGGTFRTAMKYGLYKKKNVYAEGCEKVFTRDVHEELIDDQDIKLCCRPLRQEQINEEAEKIIKEDNNETRELKYRDQKERIKAGRCMICQEECPPNMVPRAYFHQDRVGPVRLNKAVPGKEHDEAIKQMSKVAKKLLSVYGFDKHCKKMFNDPSEVQMEPKQYKKSDPNKYQYDPKILMCCDKVGNEQTAKPGKSRRLKHSFRFEQISIEQDKPKEQQDEGSQNQSLCAFCKSCDPNRHDLMNSENRIERMKGVFVMNDNCAEEDLKPLPYSKKYRVPMDLQLCCDLNFMVDYEMRDQIFDAADAPK